MNERKEKIAKRIAQQGFALLELLVVLTIIGIISVIAIPVFLSLLCSHEGDCNE